eukprot:CAMPEP_0195035474 /NCGR_PEP_ID=MMETSP0326_2-20130528/70284_1 /TAXON_ID=2866 ORGANISM="Crypthecodinium cohnii, Strain Seligo" /NCGR_SAMPLE_ID=MMETSP0326_2 /ASSEMBLY_ACC=CAM_ASM_000348 /LENGTH=85 /DNA_ID=CAMNT_0040060655 /DNA_START=106 /DNA_END=361 /DNA_ORIENTATION=+
MTAAVEERSIQNRFPHRAATALIDVCLGFPLVLIADDLKTLSRKASQQGPSITNQTAAPTAPIAEPTKTCRSEWSPKWTRAQGTG